MSLLWQVVSAGCGESVVAVGVVVVGGAVVGVVVEVVVVVGVGVVVVVVAVVVVVIVVVVAVVVLVVVVVVVGVVVVVVVDVGAVVDTANTWYVNTGITDIKLDRSQSKTQQPTPLSETEPLRWTYGKLTPEAATAWLQRLAEQGSVAVDAAACSAEQRSASAEPRAAKAEPRSACKPTAEQLKFLRAVVDRCLTEAQEEQAESSRSEPLRAVFHGVPGAGKTQTLKWLRAFFEDMCGWQHQQEFKEFSFDLGSGNGLGSEGLGPSVGH